MGFVEGLEGKTFCLDGCGCFLFIELFTVGHDDGCLVAGEEDFVDAVLRFESQTGSGSDTSALAFEFDNKYGGCFCGDFGSGGGFLRGIGLRCI